MNIKIIPFYIVSHTLYFFNLICIFFEKRLRNSRVCAIITGASKIFGGKNETTDNSFTYHLYIDYLHVM